MAQIPKAEYKCTQAELYSAVRLMLSNYTFNLADFTNYKAKYITAFGTLLDNAVGIAEALPDKETRDAKAETLRTELVTLNLTNLNRWQFLKGYITEVFDAAALKTNLDAAGAQKYNGAAAENWEKAVAMNAAAKSFMAVNSTLLLDGGNNMPPTFEADYNADMSAFNLKYEAYKPATETTVATTEKIDANNSIFHQTMDICADGQIIYRNDGAKAKLFTWSEILKVITPAGATSLTVTCVQDETGNAIAGVAISGQQSGNPVLKNGVTDANGEVKFDNIDAGDWHFSGSVVGRQNIQAGKTVTAGVGARLEFRMVL